MDLNSDQCYQALISRDSRFDGVFFVAVSSTGIYCRPVCPAKTPRCENCTFHRSAASAERAGYRPCLRCRPELAPGNAQIDAIGRLARVAACRIEDGALIEGGVEALASELGVSGRHLRRVVEQEFGVTPIELAQTSRLLLAMRLLTDTDLSVTEVAFAAGFSSLRRFNTLFKERYRLNPTGLRKTRGKAGERQTLVCEIAYCPPLEWDALIAFLRDRVCAGVETIDGDCYYRTVCIEKARGWLSIGPAIGKYALRVEVSLSLATKLRQVMATVKRAFDLEAQPSQIADQLGEIAMSRPGLRIPGSFDGFETAVRAILGQQVSVAAATTLAGRYVREFGEPFETPIAGLTHLTPAAAHIATIYSDDLVKLGILRSRAMTILGLANAVAENRISLQAGGDVQRTMDKLKELPGIGEWTAQYISMRSLRWPDAFPHTDLGIRKALQTTNSKQILEIAEAWRPWRAYAVMHLWKSLENIT